jgi:hypothetical protein
MADFEGVAHPACVCNSHRIQRARNTRIAAARAYQLALQGSIAAGEPMHEVSHDHNAWDRAAVWLMDACAIVGVDAPMVLGVPG